MKTNRMTLAQLLDASAEDVAKLPIEQLYLLQDEISAEAERIKKASALFLRSLTVRYERKAACKRRVANKSTGNVHLVDGDFDVSCDMPKRVEWDQPKLIAAFDAMGQDEARHYCKASFSVEERKFTAAPPAIQKLLEPARTVNGGTQKFMISRKDTA